MPQKVQIFNSLFPKYQCNLNPQCITFSDIVFKCILNTSKNFAQKLQCMIYNYKGYEQIFILIYRFLNLLGINIWYTIPLSYHDKSFA